MIRRGENPEGEWRCGDRTGNAEREAGNGCLAVTFPLETAGGEPRAERAGGVLGMAGEDVGRER